MILENQVSPVAFPDQSARVAHGLILEVLELAADCHLKVWFQQWECSLEHRACVWAGGGNPVRDQLGHTWQMDSGWVVGECLSKVS